MDKHAISIKWSDEDNSFVATIPGIQALSALGATREEALSELFIASDAYFEALEASGKPLPLPEKVISYSGQLRLRMPRSLHAVLSHEAEDENISLNTYIITLLSERHIEKKLLNKIEALEYLIETANSEKISRSRFNNRAQRAYKVDEDEKKYRSKKRRK
jgi:predicted HicB family RNase H-like nuclease